MVNVLDKYRLREILFAGDLPSTDELGERIGRPTPPVPMPLLHPTPTPPPLPLTQPPPPPLPQSVPDEALDDDDDLPFEPVDDNDLPFEPRRSRSPQTPHTPETIELYRRNIGMLQKELAKVTGQGAINFLTTAIEKMKGELERIELERIAMAIEQRLNE